MNYYQDTINELQDEVDDLKEQLSTARIDIQDLKTQLNHNRVVEMPKLRNAIRELFNAFIKLNGGCYPLPYSPADSWKREACDKAMLALGNDKEP